MVAQKQHHFSHTRHTPLKISGSCEAMYRYLMKCNTKKGFHQPTRYFLLLHTTTPSDSMDRDLDSMTIPDLKEELRKYLYSGSFSL